MRVSVPADQIYCKRLLQILTVWSDIDQSVLQLRLFRGNDMMINVSKQMVYDAVWSNFDANGLDTDEVFETLVKMSKCDHIEVRTDAFGTCTACGLKTSESGLSQGSGRE